jgi:predicted peptidase
MTGLFDRTVEVAGEVRRYLLYRPIGEVRPSPAILFLHGMGESGTDGLFQAFHGLWPAIVRNRAAWPFVCILPQKKRADMEWFDEKPMLDAILKRTDAEVAIDPHRRYLTGLSQGGRGTIRLAKRLTWQFAAIAPICGWADVETASKELMDVPVWLFHGERDRVVPPTGSISIFDALKEANPEAKLTLYSDLEHNSWDRAYREAGLAEWFLKHSLS